MDEHYIKIENGRFAVERDMLNLEIAKYRLQSQVYTNSHSIMEELTAHEFEVTKQGRVEIDDSLKIATNPKTRRTFEEAFTQYCSQMNNAQVFDMSAILAAEIAASRPLIKQAYDELGEAIVKGLGYNTTKIQRRLDALKQTSHIDRIITMCRRAFPIRTPIPLSEIKTQLQEMYDELGIKATAKATDIDD